MDSSNRYKKDEDPMMWQLREIRKKMAFEGLDSESITRKGREIAKQYNLPDTVKLPLFNPVTSAN